jgi:hypothetical protein
VVTIPVPQPLGAPCALCDLPARLPAPAAARRVHLAVRLPGQENR